MVVIEAEVAVMKALEAMGRGVDDCEAEHDDAGRLMVRLLLVLVGINAASKYTCCCCL